MIDKVIEVQDLPVLLAEKSEHKMMLSQSSGLSSGKLKNATATSSDVISGKTFYAGDKNLKTGTLVDRPNDVQCPVVTQYDPGTGFVYLALPAGAYRKTDGRMSPHPNIKRRLTEIVSEAGFDKGAWSTTINPGASVTIPKGFHNGSGRVTANNVQSQLKTASFSLSLFSGGIAYGEIKDSWWSPGGTVIGMTKCKIRTDTESGSACANESYCEISNDQVHFVTNYTHRGGWTYAEGTVVYI